MCYGDNSSSTVEAHQPEVQQTVNTVPQEMENRLDAAQKATGFKLNDIVRHGDSGEYGKVVGFGRINGQHVDGERVLLVEVSEDEIVAVHPTVVDLAGTLSA